MTRTATAEAPKEDLHSTPAIAIRDGAVYYGSFAALTHVTMTIQRGQFATIVGPNGGGKTTLFKLILGLIQPTRGTVRVLGKPPSEVRLSMGYVPQNAQFDPLFPIRVSDVVQMGLLNRPRTQGHYRRAEVQDRVHHALHAVGLATLAKRWFSGLSGGQRQRVLIARGLVSEPEILLLDEPTSNVDIHAEDMILDVLVRLRGKMTILLVTHYPKIAMRFLDQVFCVNRTVHVHPPTTTMDEDLMRHITGMTFPTAEAAH